MEKSIASQLLILVVAQPKSLHKLKALGQWALPDSGCTWLCTAKERRPHLPTLERVSALPIPRNAGWQLYLLG